MTDDGSGSFGNKIAIIGVILIGCGVAWLLAQNWHQIPDGVKIFILAALVIAAYWAATVARIKEYPKTASSLLGLGALLYSLSIVLIAQIFDISTSAQAYAWLFLLMWVGVFAASYLFRSGFSIIVGFFEIFVWLVLQYTALSETSSGYSVGPLALAFLAVGVLLYGLSLAHKARDHPFMRVYAYFTAFYFLAYAYLMSFQFILPTLWGGDITQAGPWIYISALCVVAVAAFVVGLLNLNKQYDKREIQGFLAIVALLLIVLFATIGVRNTAGSCQPKDCYEYSDQASCDAQNNCNWQENDGTPGYCGTNYANYDTLWETCRAYDNQYQACSAQDICSWHAGLNSYWGSRSQDMPVSMWIVWILANIAFVITVLTVLLHGTRLRDSGIVNLGMFAFGLFILTRYIGFMIDLWGYTSLAVIFILGGGVLILGGWLIEKWRRNLIKKTK